MIDEAEAIVRARAWAADRAEFVPATWPETTYNAPAQKADYRVFRLLQPKGKWRAGSSQYVAVHKVTGDVVDLGEHGE